MCPSLKYAVLGKSVTDDKVIFIGDNALETLYYYEGNPTGKLPTDCSQAKIIENSDGTLTLEFTHIPDGTTEVIIHDLHKPIRNVILPTGSEDITIKHTHYEDNGTVTVPATKEKEGEKEYRCTICGEVLRKEILPKLVPDIIYGPGVIPEPNSFTPPSINVSAEVLNGRAVLSWSKIRNASSYTVYIKRNGKYVKLTETDKTTVTVKNLAYGKSYSFKIAYSVNGRLTNNSQEIAVVMSDSKKPVVTASADEHSVSLRWSKVEGAEAYAVYKVVNGKAKKLIETQKTGVRISGLDSQTEYSYIVRVKLDGEWQTMKRSDIITVRTK